jgi:putative DNA primase/helicase
VCLAIFGTIQPGPLSRYLRGSISGDEEDGFIPRFQILMYPDPPTEFVNIDRYPDTAAKNAAYDVFKALDALDPIALGCQVDADRGMPFIGFSEEAQAFFDQWRVALETRMRAGTLSNLMTNHLAKYRSLMPALALLFHLIDSDLTVRLEPVSERAALLAAAWCDLLEAHAVRIYQAAMDGDPTDAVKLAEKIKDSLPNPFRYRDVAKKGWSGLTSSDDVRRAVDILDDRGWVKVVELPSGERGGRPTENVWIHPKLITNGVHS